MTPEQKAYFEYGLHLGIMEAARKVTSDVFKERQYKPSLHSLHELRHTMRRDLGIKAAWNARALTRRECKDCVYCLATPQTDRRRYCPKSGNYIFAESRCINCSHFERKEGK